jgi:mono/diheme cytochrome c family protein
MALLIALVVPAACEPMDTALQGIFGRSMRSQISFDPYENPLNPPEGAVSFASGNHPALPGQVNLGQHDMAPDVPPFTSTDMAANPAIPNSLVNPVPADSASLARGQVMFTRMCSICHGPEGDPSQALILPKLPAMVAFPLATGLATTRSDGYIFGMMTVGRGVMPPYGHQISYYDRWNIVNYVRVLQQRAAGGGAAPAAPVN